MATEMSTRSHSSDLSTDAPGYILELHIDQIRTDGGTQNRRCLDEAVIRAYARLIADDVVFPHLRVWFDGLRYWLVDGFHRLAAAKRAGFVYITAETLHGSLADAQWDSYSANARHGLPRTRSDTIEVLKRALSHPSGRLKSNVQIAKHLGIAEATVRRWRRRLSSSDDDDTVRNVTRRGTEYSIRVAHIGCPKIPGRSVIKPKQALKHELKGMTDRASPRATAVLRAIDAWIYSRLSAVDCLAELENILAEQVNRTYPATYESEEAQLD